MVAVLIVSECIGEHLPALVPRLCIGTPICDEKVGH
jgi:hypothetical protein